MINLTRELEAFAARGADGAQKRLADPDTRAHLRARVARAQRRANVIIAAAVVAVLGVGASAWAAPRDTAPPIQPTPIIETQGPKGRLPALDSANYLAEMRGAYRTSEALVCDIIPIAPMVAQSYPYPGSLSPLPTWIELDRIYGLHNELPPSYPIPLYSRDGSQQFGLARTAIPQLYPSTAEVVVALIGTSGEWWGFDATFQEIDAMPFDPPGIFVTLTPDPDCHGGPRDPGASRIPPGSYNVRVMVNRTDISYGNVIKDFGFVTVVTGLPSVPELNVTR